MVADIRQTPAQRRTAERNMRTRSARVAPAGETPANLAMVYLRVPWATLQLIEQGEVSSVRHRRARRGRPQSNAASPGLPMAVWAAHPWAPGWRGRLFLTEDMRIERLGDATRDAVRREGFTSHAAWKADWIERHGGFGPLDLVEVYDLAPMPENPSGLAAVALAHYLGPWALEETREAS